MCGCRVTCCACWCRDLAYWCPPITYSVCYPRVVPMTPRIYPMPRTAQWGDILNDQARRELKKSWVEKPLVL